MTGPNDRGNVGGGNGAVGQPRRWYCGEGAPKQKNKTKTYPAMMATARQCKFLLALMAFRRVRVLLPSYSVFVGLLSGFFGRRHDRDWVGGKQPRAEAGSTGQVGDYEPQET